MSKDVITLHGQDVVVREDTAKAFSGVNRAMASMIAFIAIAAALFVIFTFKDAVDTEVMAPVGAEQR